MPRRCEVDRRKSWKKAGIGPKGLLTDVGRAMMQNVVRDFHNDSIGKTKLRVVFCKLFQVRRLTDDTCDKGRLVRPAARAVADATPVTSSTALSKQLTNLRDLA